MDKIDLIKAVEDKIKEIRTRSLDLSFNELLDMYEDGELRIDPEYQRLFRWSEGKQSRFIESLILEMPVPPIFVIEKEEGDYELIDGLQRISSYLHFRGALKSKQSEVGEQSFLQLVDCDIVPELNGITYKNLPRSLGIKLKRNFIRVEILRKESDPRLRYYMFKRLNTGGEILSEQEMRNSTIRLLDETFNNFIIELSNNIFFKECIESVNEEKIEQKYDQELVLRFFAFKNNRDNYVHDVGDFLTEYMELISDPQEQMMMNFKKEREIFNKTFMILSKTLGPNIFSAKNKNGKFVSRFYIYHYEAFSIGIQKYLEQVDIENADELKKFQNLFMEIKEDATFKEITSGGGKNYSRPLESRIMFVQNKIGEIYGD